MKRYQTRFEEGELIFGEHENGNWVEFKDVQECEILRASLERLLMEKPLVLMGIVGAAKSPNNFWQLISENME